MTLRENTAVEGQQPSAVDETDFVIRTVDLTKVYPGTDFRAVDELDLNIRAGEIFGLLGPNVAGKTTMVGMLTTRVIPTAGKAYVGNINVVKRPALARQLIGVVSQQNTLDRSLTVRENLYFHGRLFGMARREIEDRVQAPCPVWLVGVSKVIFGSVQGIIGALIVFPIASVVHAKGSEAHLTVHWLTAITIIPLACVAMSSLGLLLGTKFEPRNIGLMFGFIVLPITFLGGTYYQWTRLAPVKFHGVAWLQALVLVNPLIYVSEGMRAAFTSLSHMHLYVIYLALTGFCVLFLTLGLRSFRGRVLS